MFYPWRKSKEHNKMSKHTDAKRHQNRQQNKKKGTRDLQNNQKTINKMETVSPYLSIITLKETRLNYPSYYYLMVKKKRQRKSLFNDKGVNTSRRYTNCKYSCAQHWIT